MVLFLTTRKASECALWEFCTERAWLSQWSSTERAAKKVSFSNPYSSCLSWGTATLAGTEQRWWRCGVTQSESFPGSGSEDSYKLYAVICWFKINPGYVCKVTGRCWKANANICALKKVSLVGRDLANYRLVCSRWAGIWSQRKMIYVCIIKEVTSQCLGDPRARLCCQEGGWKLSRAGQSRTAPVTLKRGALPVHHLNMLLSAGKHQGSLLLVPAAASLVSEPPACCPSPNPVLAVSIMWAPETSGQKQLGWEQREGSPLEA